MIQPWPVEIPAGRMEPGDASPEAAARRELREETGYALDRFVQLAGWTPNSATHNNTVHAMAALDARQLGEPEPDREENIEFEFMEIPRLIALIDGGQFRQALHIATLYQAWRRLDGLSLKR